MNEYSQKILDDKFNDSGASKKLQSQTLREFLEECRLAVLEEGFTEQEIIEVRQKRDDSIATDDFEEADRKFIEMLIPIYINLRLKGYKYYPDIIG